MTRNHATEHRLRQLLLVAAAVALPAMTASAAEGDYSRKGADTCLSCHEEDFTYALFRGKHAVPSDPNGPFGHGQLQCEACHGPSGDHSGRVRRGQERPPSIDCGSGAATPIAVQNDMCMGCHEADTGFGWHGSEHDRNIACADCHTSHAATDPVLVTSTQADVCVDCHQQQRTQLQKPYSHPVRQGKMACSDCHSAHGATTGEWQLALQTVNDTCFQCHADKRGPYLWEHAPVAEDCSNCHDPHGSNHPGMVKLRGPMLCQGCHSQAGHPSIAADESGLPGGSPSPFLLGQNCMNCHNAVHGSNHPSGSRLMR